MASPLQNDSDSELTRLTRAGSLAAFEELVYRYEGRLYRFVVNICRNHADASEITQDAFVRAFQAITQFDPAQPFAPWLFTIARRKCIDHYRAAPPPSHVPLPDLPEHDNPAEALACREDQQNLWLLARRQLSEVQFQVLWLKYAEDMSVADIARVLRKTQTHIKVVLFRARLALGRELLAAGFAGRHLSSTSVKPRSDGKRTLAASMLGRLPTVKP